jgi:hypothetical protein
VAVSDHGFDFQADLGMGPFIAGINIFPDDGHEKSVHLETNQTRDFWLIKRWGRFSQNPLPPISLAFAFAIYTFSILFNHELVQSINNL